MIASMSSWPVRKTTLIVNWPSLSRAMVKVDLKGIAKVTSKGRTYYYAWRGGPRLRGEPGTPEFHRSTTKR